MAGLAARGRIDPARARASLAAIRHRHTNDDELLMQGDDRTYARHKTRDKVEELLDRWRSA